MSLRAFALSAPLLLALCGDGAISHAQPIPPSLVNQSRPVGGWLVVHEAEGDGGRIVRMTRVHDSLLLEYHVAFWRGNGGPFSQASVVRGEGGCGSEDWRRDPTGDIWAPETDMPGVARRVRATLVQALAECGVGPEQMASALGGFESAFGLASAWAEVGRLATLAEIEMIASGGPPAEMATAAEVAAAEAEIAAAAAEMAEMGDASMADSNMIDMNAEMTMESNMAGENELAPMDPQ